jgi:hypothetical protein
MTPFTKNFILKSILLGSFTINGNDMKFDTHLRNSNGKIDRKYIINLGPVVYIMVCANTGELIKIGKAAGEDGFYGRMGTYNTGYFGDKTNAKIMRYMNSIKQNKVLVYAIRTPTKKVEIYDELNNTSIYIESDSAYSFEQKWTREARESGEALNGSTQK